MILLAALVLVAPATAQPPDDPGSQGEPSQDAGQGRAPPQSPPGQEGNDDADADPDSSEPANPEGQGNQSRPFPAVSTTAGGISCRLVAMGVDLATSPTGWFRADPDGCVYYAIKRLIERPGA